jgi:hypothetical protein
MARVGNPWKGVTMFDILRKTTTIKLSSFSSRFPKMELNRITTEYGIFENMNFENLIAKEKNGANRGN